MSKDQERNYAVAVVVGVIVTASTEANATVRALAMVDADCMGGPAVALKTTVIRQLDKGEEFDGVFDQMKEAVR